MDGLLPLQRTGTQVKGEAKAVGAGAKADGFFHLKLSNWVFLHSKPKCNVEMPNITLNIMYQSRRSSR